MPRCHSRNWMFFPRAACRKRRERWVYAAGRRPEIPLEPKKPLACGEAVRMVPGADVGRKEAARREEVIVGWGLK